ncbi:hypothetical protein Tco_1210901 [Tanacetum coccineum]
MLASKRVKSLLIYVLKDEGYVEQLKTLGDMLPKDISVDIGKGIVLCNLAELQKKGRKLLLPVLQGFRIEMNLNKSSSFVQTMDCAQETAIRSFDFSFKHNLGLSRYLWHCRLSSYGNKKRIMTAATDGLLKSTDDDSLINVNLVI